MNKHLSKNSRARLPRAPSHKLRSAAPRPNRFHAFLRRLRAGGRSNMYGAIPYLMHAFELDRDAAYRVVCEWVDQETKGADAGTNSVHPEANRRPR